MFNRFRRAPDYHAAAEALARHGVDEGLHRRFAGFLAAAPDRELFHLNPRALAARLAAPERETLRLLVAAVYEGLVNLQRTYGDQGFTVVGFPCNQFLGQEPGSAEEIQEFCSTTYGVDFPLMEKIEVNGEARHPLYAELTEVPDAEGEAGDIQWNFEKFLVAPGGEVTRFRPGVEPEAPELVAAIEANLPN